MTTDIQGETGISSVVAAAIAGASSKLAEAIGSPVQLALDSVEEQIPPPGVEDIHVRSELSGGLSGEMRLVMDGADASAIVAAVVPEADPDAELDDAGLNSLQQAMENFFAGAAEALSAGPSGTVTAATPSVSTEADSPPPAGTLTATFSGDIAGAEDSRLFWFISPELAETMSAWDSTTDATTSSPEPVPPTAPAAPAAPAVAPASAVPAMPGGGVIDSVELDIAVELGNVAMAIGELLHMGEGSVVTLTQAVGDRVVMLANGTPVANGEVVVVDGTLGFRVSELISEAPGA